LLGYVDGEFILYPNSVILKVIQRIGYRFHASVAWFPLSQVTIVLGRGDESITDVTTHEWFFHFSILEGATYLPLGVIAN
jgi:hypothetical protein